MLQQGHKIPLFVPDYGMEERLAVDAVLNKGYLNEGPYVRQFEKMFAEYVGAKYCALVPNGRIALYMAMMQQDPSWASIPAYYGIFAAQAAREADVDMSIMDVEKNGCTRKDYPFLIAIHTNGRIGNVETIEDCCQAISHHSKNAVSCYSFHSTKIMTCGGIGGAVCCDDEVTYETLTTIKDHGRPSKGDLHPYWGSNFKMSDLNAAFGIEQLKKLPKRLERLHETYSMYQELLGDKVRWLEGAPSWRIDCIVDNPARVIERLAKDGIEAKRFYLPTYRQPQFQDEPAKFPNCEYLYNHGLYLPSLPSLTDDQIAYICERLKVCLQ